MPLDRRAQRLLDMLAAGRATPDARSSPADRRAALEALASAGDDVSTEVEIEDRQISGLAGPLPIRIYTPLDSTRTPTPGLVFFHGGGWVAGSLETHDGLCRRLCEAAGCRIVAVGYRLAPEHPFPAGLTDCLLALNWVSNHARMLGIDPSRLAVGGDSAGAGLAAAVAQIAREAAGPDIALQVLICPILDVARRTRSRSAFGDGYFIGAAAFESDHTDNAGFGPAFDDPRLSPLHASGFTGLPPALIHTAEFDPFRDEAEDYAETLRDAGVEVTAVRHPGMIHYFYALARAIPYAEAASAVIGAQMRAAFAGAEPGEAAAAARAG